MESVILLMRSKSDNKKVWGPIGWKALHTLAIMYPDTPTYQDEVKAINSIKAIINNLPCPECVKHATEYFNTTPPDLSTSFAFQKWVFTFHSMVSARLNKPIITWDQYREMYKSVFEIKRSIRHRA